MGALATAPVVGPCALAYEPPPAGPLRNRPEQRPERLLLSRRSIPSGYQRQRRRGRPIAPAPEGSRT
jgi:hypothetical protein